MPKLKELTNQQLNYQIEKHKGYFDEDNEAEDIIIKLKALLREKRKRFQDKARLNSRPAQVLKSYKVKNSKSIGKSNL